MIQTRRNLSIDILRGLTMLLMVFVNDFWTVLDVPHFLEHFGPQEDGMGLSDIIYPMFLFAMGMSVPLALDRRREKGCSGEETLRHILSRTLALLVMGVFIVNAEGEISPVLGYNKGVYWMLMVIGFFLVWNAYPHGFRYKRLLRGLGIAVLLFLALTFRYPDGGYFQASWWGILGQIGWMYLFSSLAYLLCREKTWILAVLWLGFALVNLTVTPMRDGQVLVGTYLLGDFSEALHLGNGHAILMSLGGMLTVLSERKLAGFRTPLRVGIGLSAAAVLAVLGAAVHAGWVVSKYFGTLPWCLYVSAISVAAYTVFRLLERYRLTGWFAPFRPAGTATLTVYMIPYFWYCFWVFFHLSIPAWLTGWTGVVKCALFSLLCLGTAWLLDRAKIRLKI